ncbi:MAG: protein kinase, partial [Myxococcota bacterium]
AAFGAPDPSEEGLLKGKLAYMAPEQARGDVVDRRSDVFAVGVVLFELLSGAPMWADRSDRGVYAEVIAGLLPDIHQRAPSAPEGLREICEIALARDPAERFASAAAMRQALDEWLDETGGRPNPRALGERVSELFAADRERIKALIAQGRATDDPTDDTDLNGPTPMPRGRSRATPRPALVSTATPMPTRPPTSMRWVVPVGGALGALAAGSLAAIGIVAVAAGWWLWGRPPVVPIDGACPATGRPVVELSGQIDADATLPCTRDYRLVGVVRVEEGATLTIAPGTVIRGAPGSVLAVSRGGRIVADGTAEAPIVLTSAAPNPRPGDWGGLVVLGRAPTNQPDLRFKGLVPEGDPVGGDDPSDDSGVLRYLRIAYAGYVVAPNNETNGVTFAGVGSGTVVDHVEVRSGADDCFEWFGGTVDASNLVCIDPGDDGYDIEWGYVGTLSSIVVVDRADGSPEHHGIEVDNDATAFAAEPRSAPTVRGATLCGPGSAGGGYGLVVRRGALGTYADLWVDGFAAAFDLRDGGGAPAVSAVVVAPGVPLGPREDQPVDARSAAADDDGGFDEAAGISAGAAGPACPVPPVGPVGALRPTDRWDAGWVHWD